MQANLSAATGQPASRTASLPYLPGLDGLRALAIVAVLLYHADLGVAGGFLGVEAFFVLSGFLITALLLAEWRQHGRIDLTAFWLRRARRLLPALAFMLAGTVVFASVLLRGETMTLRDDLLAAIGYVMNWHLIASGQSYFDPLVRPPLLQHLWSLAVEEQFYLLWPVLFGAGLRYMRFAGLLIMTLSVAAASIVLAALLYEPGADPSRIYYGTDTRAAGLLLGAALALVWTPGERPVATSRGAGWLLDLAGSIALGGLIASFVWLYEYHPLLYRGGFAMVALSTAVVIAAATHPRARLVVGLLGWSPLRWIGQRSYAIYLWYWPIFMVTRPYLDVPIDGWPLLTLRLAIVLALAELSYRFVELPVRKGAIGQAWRVFWARRRSAPAPRGGHSLRWRWLYVPMASLLLLVSAGYRSRIDAQSHSALVTTTATVTSPLRSAATTPAVTPSFGSAVTLPLAGMPSAVTPATDLPTKSSAELTALVPSMTTRPQPAPGERALVPLDPALAAELQRILDATVADGAIPGVVLAVQVPGYQSWTGASGIADQRTTQPMQPATLIRIGSLSKMFTAVVVLQLAEERKIELDAPIATWLPELVPNGDSMTVRQLLQHTSGLYDYLEDRSLVNRTYREPGRVWAPRELVEYAIGFPLAFQPGEEGAWNYSSTNYVLLGMIVEQVTGNTLAQELRQRIFDPLGLTQTFAAPTETISGVQARGYSNSIDQTDAPMSFVFATANIVSTAADVQRFVQALVGGELLMPDTLAMMNQFVNGKGRYKMPELEYGLGLMRNWLPVGPGPDGQPRPAEASTVLGHIGGYGGFRAAVWSAPESGISIALGVNQAATDPNTLATQVFDAILTQQGR